jgi:hypothetical protein
LHSLSLSLALFLYLSSYIQTSAKYQTFLSFAISFLIDSQIKTIISFLYLDLRKKKGKETSVLFSLNVTTTTTTISYWGQNATMSQI